MIGTPDFSFFFPFAGYPLDVPPLSGRVNDTAGMLSAGLVSSWSRNWQRSRRPSRPRWSSSPSRRWRGNPSSSSASGWPRRGGSVGKGTDNGAILILSKQERKIRIEVGRGLEGRLTDLTSGRIIRNEIAPRLKAGDIDGGITAGLGAIMAAVKGEYAATPRDLQQGKQSAPPVFALLIFALVICVFLSAISRFLSGAAGAVLLPLAAWLSFSSLCRCHAAWSCRGRIRPGDVHRRPVRRGRTGRGGGFGGGPWIGGGFGGGFGGGSSGGGGFSGGGGSFGGGGASGDW